MEKNELEQYELLGDYVLVEEQTDNNKTKAGIILTQATQRGQTIFGKVLLVGSGIFTQNGSRIPMSTTVGDLVMYKKDMAGDPITLDDKKYLLFHEHDLIMIKKQK